jgi:hypothetical protein
MARHLPRLAPVVLAVLALLAPGNGRSEEPEEVPLYTNADLERFEVPASSPPTKPRDPDADWKFVQEHLDRQARLADAEADRELEQRWAEAEIEASRDDDDRYLSAIWGAGGWCLDRSCSWSRGWRHHTARPPHVRYDSRDDHRGRIVPLHARSQIVPLHARGRIAPMPKTKAEDAFPSRSRGRR